MKNRDEIKEILKKVAPGTLLRDGIDSVLEARTGALVVIAKSEEILKIADGGFDISCEYKPQKLYELSKMDGAIILNETSTKILNANVQLQPDPTITTFESGTRHRTAERVGKQTGSLVITISKRRSRVTLFQGETSYVLRKTQDIIQEVDQALKTMERYKTVLEKALTNLTIMEFDDLVTLYEVLVCIQRFEMMFRIADFIDLCIVELGEEGRFASLQLKELITGTKEEMESLLKDYINNEKENISIEKIKEELAKLSQEELLEAENISYILGYGRNYNAFDSRIVPKGYRLLEKIVKLTKRDVEKLISSFKEFNNILEATTEELASIKTISKFKARSIKNGLNRLKFMTMLEK